MKRAQRIVPAGLYRTWDILEEKFTVGEFDGKSNTATRRADIDPMRPDVRDGEGIRYYLHPETLGPSGSRMVGQYGGE